MELFTEGKTAQDIVNLSKEDADNVILNLWGDVGVLQKKLDRLVYEYCPWEMTEDQRGRMSLENMAKQDNKNES